MADRAARKEMIARFLQVLWSGFPRIRFFPRARWDGEVAHQPCRELLNGGRLFVSAEAMVNQHNGIDDAENNEHQAPQ